MRMHNYEIEANPIRKNEMAISTNIYNYHPLDNCSIEELNQYRVACLREYRIIRDSNSDCTTEAAFTRFNSLRRYIDATKQYTRALSQVE